MGRRIFGFPTSRQSQSCIGDSNGIEEFSNRYIERACEGLQHVDGDILGASFNPADVRAIDVAGQSQSLLRQPPRHSQASQICTDGLSRVHATAPKHSHCLTIDGLSVPYYGKFELCFGAKYPMPNPARPCKPLAALQIGSLLFGLILTSTAPSFAQVSSRPSSLLPSELADQIAAEPLAPLSGTWRSVNDAHGCTDEDGKGNAVVGQFDFDANGRLVMGKGPPRLGFYEALCSLDSIQNTNGRFEMNADCVNEGEPSRGSALVEVLGADTIRIETPAISGTFKACTPEQIDGIAVVTGRAAPKPVDAPAAPPTVAIAPLGGDVDLSQSRPNLDPQRNAVAMVIADYCRPDFYEAGHWGNGDWDPTYYDRYKQQLLVRYASYCDTFQKSEYEPFILLDEVWANNPNLLPPGRAALSDGQAFAAGYYLWMANAAAASQCDLAASTPMVTPDLIASMHTALNRATEGDQKFVAMGYGVAKTLAAQRTIFDVNPPVCGSNVAVLNGLWPLATEAGLAAFSSTGPR